MASLRCKKEQKHDSAVKPPMNHPPMVHPPMNLSPMVHPPMSYSPMNHPPMNHHRLMDSNLDPTPDDHAGDAIAAQVLGSCNSWDHGACCVLHAMVPTMATRVLICPHPTTTTTIITTTTTTNTHARARAHTHIHRRARAHTHTPLTRADHTRPAAEGGLSLPAAHPRRAPRSRRLRCGIMGCT